MQYGNAEIVANYRDEKSEAQYFHEEKKVQYVDEGSRVWYCDEKSKRIMLMKKVEHMLIKIVERSVAMNKMKI